MSIKIDSNKFIAAIICLFALLGMSSLSAAPAFYDNFDSEPAGGDGSSSLSNINFNGFNQWAVTDGTVDLIANGDFGPITCVGNLGKCVDLDGTSGDAGVMTSIDIALAPGVYRLDLQLAGVSSNFATSGAPAALNDVNITLGGFVDIDLNLAQGDPFTLVSDTFEVLSPTIANIVIANLGGDNHGAVLDEVSLNAVPIPASIWLLASALGGLLARRSCA